MSDRFIKFNDEQLDAKQVMMLQDLARLLLKTSKHKLKFKNSLFTIHLVILLLQVGFGPTVQKKLKLLASKQMLC